MNKWFLLLLCSALILALATPAVGLEIRGVTFPDTINITGKTLHLVGGGMRTKTFLRIKVYIGALYMEKKRGDAKSIIGSDEPKRMVMHFLYHKVGKQKLVDGWNEGFQANSGNKLEGLKVRIQAFNSFFDSDVKKGEEVILTYLPGMGTEINIKGELKGTIQGKDFMEALFKIWFGDHPADKDLKKEILKQ
jgi:hypothetical protein